MTSVHLHQSLTESLLVLALTSSCVVDEGPDFELTADISARERFPLVHSVAVHGGVTQF